MDLKPGTEYTVSDAGIEYSLPDTPIHIGDAFTVDLNAENVTDLAGWQFDIVFDPAVLEAVEVNKGDFLESRGGTTFFQKGAIDNATGKITDLSSVDLTGKGCDRHRHTAVSDVLSKNNRRSEIGHYRTSQLGAITGDQIAAESYEIVITITGALIIGDVNRDGQISVLDMILIAQYLGETAPANAKVDINNDGVISILDLILVAQRLGESTATAAPSVMAINSINELTPAVVQAWIERAELENDGSIAFQQGIANLQRLLASLVPEETTLLPNYPNPFNPETWIPYHLANPSHVTIILYNAQGTIVRQLKLGHQHAGYYTNKHRAAYWDGRNELGERVASGIYFYQLQAGNISHLKKLVILK